MTKSSDAKAAKGASTSDLPVMKAAGRYTMRFGFIYGILGLVAVGAAAGLIVLVVKPNVGGGTSSSWSSFKPSSGSTATMTRQIAQHFQDEYHLNKAGAQLVAVVAGPPQYTQGTHKVIVSNIALRKPKSKDVQIIPSGKTWMYQFCGLGVNCSIASGKPSPARQRLVRREALEVALTTFKFVPTIDSIVAFMPPPPGETGSTLLYLQRDQLKKQISEPLRNTLPLAKPPLPNDPNSKEAKTIDGLTLSTIYSFAVQGLQDQSALLVLDPILT